MMLLAGGAMLPASATPGITPTPTLTLTGTPALSGPTSAVVHDGNLWVADYSSGKVYEYQGPSFTASEAPVVTLSVTYPQQLTFDASGNLWVGTWSTSVYEFSAPIANGASPSVTLSGLNEPTGVTLHQGNLWVFSYGSSSVYQYSPEPTANSATPPTPILTPSSEPVEGAFDSSGNLWVANYSPATVSEYAGPVQSGESVSATLSVTGAADLSSLAFDGAGNLWVAAPYNSGVVTKFAAPLTNGEAGTSEITISSSDSIWGVSVDTAGNVWVASFSDSAAYEFSGLASPFNSQAPSPLPSVIPTTLSFYFTGSSTNGQMTGKLVSVEGDSILYNLPGYSPSSASSPFAISVCYLASEGLMRVTGFTTYQAGFNSTEILVSDYSSFLTNAQGWPTEAACTG